MKEQTELFKLDISQPIEGVKTPKVGDKKWDGSVYTAADIELIKAGNKNISEAVKDMWDVVKLPEGTTDKAEPFQYFAAGIDPYNDLVKEGSYAVLLKEGEGVDKGKLIAEYLGRSNKGEKWEVPFPDLIKEMQQYYGNNLIKERPKAIMSIDPGSLGAIAVLNASGEVFTYKIPTTPKDLFDLFKTLKNEYIIEATLEKVGGMPGNGGSRMFNFGQGYGYIEMALIALEIKTTTVSSQAWQKTFLIGTKSKLSTTEWKNKLKAKAQQLYPHLKITLGNADALLILEYAKNLKK